MGNNSNLTVYKASAGSGKTFRLAVRYITMLVNNPENYRSILAVTFTNKATAEMKQRILSQLYGIGHGLKSSESYFQEVKKSVRADERTIRHQAILALDSILQDYGRFRVETIDSFFQSVLRSLARELNIGAGLSLELDTESVIDQAVDSFLASIDQNSDDKRNVMRFVEDNIDNDRNWSIDRTLKKFSKELFREIFMESGDRLREILQNKDAVKDYQDNLITARDNALPPMEQEVMNIGAEIESGVSAAGITPDMLGRNIGNEINKVRTGAILEKDLTATFNKCIDQPDVFFKADVRRKNPALVNLVEDRFSPLFARVRDLHDRYTHLSHSYEAALNYLHELSLLLSIRHEIDRQSQEQQRFILADTPMLLDKLKLEGSDTSFVYEKTGSFISHLMIDEFQDTSRLQWSNLRLLLRECLASGQDCLVVGDVKQSIYRWRNSDWNILNTGLEQEMSVYNPTVEPMDTNFRSASRVIAFNNALFPMAVQAASDFYMQTTGLTYPKLEKAYESVDQLCSKDRDEGYVYARIINQKYKADELTDVICPIIAEHLDRLTAAGVRQTDIAILLRYSKEIARIANWFALNRPEYRMISGEAFQLDSSVSVRMIVNSLKWLADSTDRIALTNVAWDRERILYGEKASFDQVATNLEQHLPASLVSDAQSLRNLPLYELTEKLFSILELSGIEGQDQYVMAFMDTLSQWLTRNPADIQQFITAWDEKLYKTSIPAPDIDGIRLLTIHKSKGLEYHTVIVPFCNWSVIDSGNSSHEERLWVTPAEEPFTRMPFLPIKFESKLKDSAFQSDYMEEAGLQTVDNLNLLYVALTRAVKNLIILSAPKNTSSMFDILQASLAFMEGCNIDNDGITYETGDICPHTEKAVESSENPFDCKPTPQDLTLRSYPINARFRQSGDSARFVHSDDDQEERREEYIKTGSLLHSLFATIRTEADIDAAVDRMLSDGLLESRSKADSLKRQIRSHIAATPGASEWFNGNYTLFNESSIIFRDGGVLQNRRPDRVIIGPDGRAVVIDFKFGREREEYMHQVQEYMDLLRKMGYQQVEGHIWYVYSNKITDC